MVKWPKVKLADCVNLLAGFPFKSQQFTNKPDDVPLVKGENVSQGCILWDISKRWLASDWEKMEKFHLLPGDVVVAMDRPWIPAGLKWAFIREGDPKALLVQRCARLRSSNGRLDQTFLRFVIGGPGFENYVIPITTGVNVPHISGQQILDFAFTLPPLPLQWQIAGILSAYDKLMENSQRRIRILEAMARALYREWFVHFRFPGHEKVPRVASPLGDIPKGWEVTTFGVLYNTGSGGTPSRTRPEYFIDGTIDWVKSQELLDGFVLSTEERITERALEESSAKLFPANAVLIALYGATIGKLAILARAAATNQACCAILPKRAPFGREFAFLTLLLNRERIISLRLGAAQQNISQILLRNFECLKPTNELVRCFSEQVGPLFDGILMLQKKIQNLRRTRDLLLPRLLSGQMELASISANGATSYQPGA